MKERIGAAGDNPIGGALCKNAFFSVNALLFKVRILLW